MSSEQVVSELAYVLHLAWVCLHISSRFGSESHPECPMNRRVINYNDLAIFGMPDGYLSRPNQSLTSWLTSQVILFYDWGLTLMDEIQYVWMRKWTITTALFFLNRCLVVFEYAVLPLSIWVRWTKDSVRAQICLSLIMMTNYLSRRGNLWTSLTSMGKY